MSKLVVALGAFASSVALTLPVAGQPAVYDWSGFYVGAGVGHQSSRIGLSSPAPGSPLTYSPVHKSLIGGAHAGYQQQFGQFVFGVEGSWIVAAGQESFRTPSVFIFVPGGTGAANASFRDAWTFGGRAGFAFDRWLPYVTGGIASGRFAFNAVGGGVADYASPTIHGTYLGGGFEYAWAQNWTVGIEYRRYNFRTRTVNAPYDVGGYDPITFAPRTDALLARASFKIDPFR